MDSESFSGGQIPGPPLGSVALVPSSCMGPGLIPTGRIWGWRQVWNQGQNETFQTVPCFGPIAGVTFQLFHDNF